MFRETTPSTPLYATQVKIPRRSLVTLDITRALPARRNPVIVVIINIADVKKVHIHNKYFLFWKYKKIVTIVLCRACKCPNMKRPFTYPMLEDTTLHELISVA